MDSNLSNFFQLQETETKLVFCTPLTAELTREAIELSGRSIKLVCIGHYQGITNLFKLLENVTPEEAPEMYIPIDPKEEIALIFWSSGTTGMMIIQILITLSIQVIFTVYRSP